jgi:hypothetical protein
MDFMNPNVRKTQPAIRKSPPMGVIIPNLPIPERHRTYNDPEKIITPIAKE